MANTERPTKHRVSKVSKSRRQDPRGESLNRSQGRTSRPTLMAIAGISLEDDIVTRTMEFQMTVSIKVTELSNRQASMLLSVCNVYAVTTGVDFSLYLTMEFLYSYLWKNGHDPLETANDKIRKTLILSDIIFANIRGKWLSFQDAEELPKEIIEEIYSTGWLPDKRTFDSWKPYWNPSKFLQIRTVPLDAHWHRNRYQTAEKYSGYTKGYGNDGSPASPGKTKPTRELDGDDTEKPPPQLSLQEFNDYQTAIRLIEYSKARRKQKQ